MSRLSVMHRLSIMGRLSIMHRLSVMGRLSLTAIHLIRGILTIHKLVAATGVPDAGSIPAAELAHATGGL